MKPGRVSSAALSVVETDVTGTSRPRAPAELTPEQSREWAVVVNRMPADWFGAETYPLLVQYCRHVVSSDRVAQLIAAAEAGDQFDVREYDQLLKMQEREGRAMSALATRMRLTQQTTYDKSKRKPSAAKRPWEV